jgi:hypothetical protein
MTRTNWLRRLGLPRRRQLRLAAGPCYGELRQRLKYSDKLAGDGIHKKS